MKRVGGSSGHRLETDAELNIVSIVDCLTVLIIYLLTVVSFISVGSLQPEVAGRGGASTGSEAAPTVVTVNLKTSHSIIISVSGGNSIEVPQNQNAYDFEAASNSVNQAKTNIGRAIKVVLLADSDVSYGSLVEGAYLIGKSTPVVLAAGD